MGKIIVKDQSLAESSGTDDFLSEKLQLTKETEDLARKKSTEVDKYVNVAASTGGKISIKGTTSKKSPSRKAKSTDISARPRHTKLVKAGRRAKALPSGTTKPRAGKRSMSGLVMDGTIRPRNTSRQKASALISEAPENIDWGDGSSRQPKAKDEDKPDSFTPKYSKVKSALIGVGVTLGVALVGFSIIWFTNRKEPELCMVQFESSGGTQVNSEQTVCGTPIAKPEDPSKIGFIFKGWFYEGSVFDFDNIPIDNNIILIAKWDVDQDVETVTVKFNSNGGSKIDDIVVAKGASMHSAPISPTRTGYIFDGWYLNGQRFDFMTEINEDLTLTAKWKESPKEEPNNKPNQNKPSTNPENPPAATCKYTTKNDLRTIELEVNKSVILSPNLAYYNLDNCRVVYKIKDGSIASISGATLSGTKGGTTSVSICATDTSGKELECISIPVKIVEIEKPEIESISIGDQELIAEETKTFSVTITPNDAEFSLEASSSDSNIATCTASGNSVSCTGHNSGTVTITIRDSKSSKTATFNLAVKEAAPPEIEATSISLNTKTLNLAEGATYTLIATVKPDDTTNKAVTWSSGDTSVATVNENGEVTAIAEGTVVITAKTANGKIDTCTITITKRTETPPESH